jgi:hypothetical protein
MPRREDALANTHCLEFDRDEQWQPCIGNNEFNRKCAKILASHWVLDLTRTWDLDHEPSKLATNIEEIDSRG